MKYQKTQTCLFRKIEGKNDVLFVTRQKLHAITKHQTCLCVFDKLYGYIS